MKVFFTLISLFILHTNLHANKIYFPPWAKKDRANYRTTLRNLEYLKSSPKSFLDHFPKLHDIAQKDLGFGTTLYTCTFFGGYGIQWISLIAVKDKIASLTVTLDDKSSAVLDQTLKRDKEYPMLRIEAKKHVHFQNLNMDYRDSTLYASFLKCVEDSLGKVEIDIKNLDDSSREIYLFMTNPMHSFVYGKRCGYALYPQYGWIQSTWLRKSQKYDVLKAILRCPNPEGRIYAFDELWLLYTEKQIGLSKSDKATMKFILSMSITVESCMGCESFVDTTAKDLFPQICLDDNFLKN